MAQDPEPDRARIEADERRRKLDELERIQEVQRDIDRRHKSQNN